VSSYEGGCGFEAYYKFLNNFCLAVQKIF